MRYVLNWLFYLLRDRAEGLLHALRKLELAKVLDCMLLYRLADPHRGFC